VATLAVAIPNDGLQLFVSGPVKPVAPLSFISGRKQAQIRPQFTLFEIQMVNQNQKQNNRRSSCFFRFKLYLCCKCGQLINWQINSILSRHNKIYQILKQVYHRIVLRQLNSIHVNSLVRPTFTLCLRLCSNLPDFRLSSWF